MLKIFWFGLLLFSCDQEGKIRTDPTYYEPILSKSTECVYSRIPNKRIGRLFFIQTFFQLIRSYLGLYVY